MIRQNAYPAGGYIIFCCGLAYIPKGFPAIIMGGICIIPELSCAGGNFIPKAEFGESECICIELVICGPFIAGMGLGFICGDLGGPPGPIVGI